MHFPSAEAEILILLGVLIGASCVLFCFLPDSWRRFAAWYIVYNALGAVYVWAAYSLYWLRLPGEAAGGPQGTAAVLPLVKLLVEIVFCPALFFSTLHVKFPIFGNVSYVVARTQRISVRDPNFVAMIYWLALLVVVLLRRGARKGTKLPVGKSGEPRASARGGRGGAEA